MSAENNVTVTFLSPLPPSACRELFRLLGELDFRDDWDGDPVAIEEHRGPDLYTPPQKCVSVFARDVYLENQQRLIAVAKKYHFSIICHSEYTRDYESECKGAVMAYDATDGRTIDCSATCNTGTPLLELDAEVAQHLPKDLLDEYRLPADLIQAAKRSLPPAAIQTIEETEAKGELRAYAAAAAMRELHRNWVDALNDGHTLGQVLPDIDGVIAELKDHKRRLQERLLDHL